MKFMDGCLPITTNGLCINDVKMATTNFNFMQKLSAIFILFNTLLYADSFFFSVNSFKMFLLCVLSKKMNLRITVGIYVCVGIWKTTVQDIGVVE